MKDQRTDMASKRTLDVVLLTALTGLGLSLVGKRRQPAANHPDTTVPDSPTGADADNPLEIPRRAWLQIGKRVMNQVVEDRVLAEAAAVTFYTLLALFPAIAALISLYGLVADPAAIESHLSLIGGLVPGGGMDIITAQVHSLTSAGHKALGLGAFAGILISLWSASAGIRAIFDALNAVYEEKESRGFFRRVLLSLGFTVGGIVFVALVITAVVAVPVILDYAGLKSSTDVLLRLARWPVLLAAVTFMLAMIYRFGPSRARAKWRWVSWGSGFAAVAWVLASAAFSYYAANFGSYNRTYGSLGAAVGFMTWIWISTIIMLVGAELNAEMEHQTARDTTAGAPQPRGMRGATKADEVAA
jgi:membrane protein